MTAEADTLQATCQHDKGIQTWRFADGTPAGMWSCTQCARKFVPLDLAMERDAARWQWIKPRLFGADFDYQGQCVLTFTWPPTARISADLDFSVDAARSAAQKAER